VTQYKFTGSLEFIPLNVVINAFCGDDTAEPIHVWSLCTATYGTNCAAYLSTILINQLSMDETEHLLASEIVHRDFYLNDCLAGTSN
jgi:hypothetical protein